VRTKEAEPEEDAVKTVIEPPKKRRKSGKEPKELEGYLLHRVVYYKVVYFPWQFQNLTLKSFLGKLLLVRPVHFALLFLNCYINLNF